jgi:hypothetical protein
MYTHQYRSGFELTKAVDVATFTRLYIDGEWESVKGAPGLVEAFKAATLGAQTAPLYYWLACVESFIPKAEYLMSSSQRLLPEGFIKLARAANVVYSSEWLIKTVNLNVLNSLTLPAFSATFQQFLSSEEARHVFEYIDVYKTGRIHVHFLATFLDLCRAYRGKIGHFPLVQNNMVSTLKNKSEVYKLAVKTHFAFETFSADLTNPNSFLSFERFVEVFGKGVSGNIWKSLFRALDIYRSGSVMYYHVLSCIDSYVDVV